MTEDKSVEANSNTGMLIDLVKGVAVLNAEFKAFKSERSEDNTELKASIKKIEDKVEKLQTDVNNLKAAPIRDKASRWEGATKIVFETVLAACLVVVLVKIGLK